MIVRCRVFTPEQEELMHQQAQGAFSMHVLERSIGASRESIMRRMRELGLQPLISKRKHLPAPVMPDVDPQDAFNASPHVGKDRLLQRLREHHSGRDEWNSLDIDENR